MPMLLTRLLRCFFHLLYNPLAAAYDLVSWSVSIGQWRCWQRAALAYLRPGPVLEVAHGTGDLLLDLHQAGRRPVGLDLSANMGRLARRKLAARGLRLPLLRGRVQALPLAAGSFANLVSTFPAEFILDPAALAEFYRVLAPGGVLIIVPAAHITGAAWPDRLARGLFRVTGQAGAPDLGPLAAPLASAGFTARLEQARLARSVALVVIAEKPA